MRVLGSLSALSSLATLALSVVALAACASDATAPTPSPSDDDGGSATPVTHGHAGIDAGIEAGSTSHGEDGGTPTPTPGKDAGTPKPSPGVDSGTPTPTPGVDGGTANGVSPNIGGCDIFPADNPWNEDISAAPLDTAAMTTIMPNMHGSTGLHPDWGNVASTYGIPFNVSQSPQVLMTWTQSWAASESDQVPCALGQFCYPIPPNAAVEGGPNASADSDRHVLVIDTTGAPSNCTLYELWQGTKDANDDNWSASNGAVFHLGSDALRPDGWTSADAAGLPIMPGLVKWQEVAAGAINHAMRFTMNNTYNGYIHPATHAAGLSSVDMPPMGMRMRLMASFDTSGLSGPALVIATAMKKYGVILADNGSNWYISGDSNDGWTDDVMDDLVSQLGSIKGSDFEIVQSGTVSTAGL